MQFQRSSPSRAARASDIGNPFSPVGPFDAAVDVEALLEEVVLLRRQVAMAAETSRTIADRLPLLVVYVDAEGRYQYVNRRFTEWFGFSPESIIGKLARDVMVSRVQDLLRDSHLRALSGKRAGFQGSIPFAFGGTRYLTIDYLPHRDDNGAVLGYIAVAADLTAQKAAEAGLYETQVRLQLLADAGITIANHGTAEVIAEALADRVVADFADLCVIDLVTDGRASRVACATAARVAPDIAPALRQLPFDVNDRSDPLAFAFRRSDPVLFTHDAREARSYARNAERESLIDRLGVHSTVVVRIEHEGVRHGVMAMCRSDAARPFTVADRATALDLAGRLGGRLSAVELTRRLRAANSVKDEILGLVSHELRTPLTTVKGNANLLRRRAETLDPTDRAEVFADLERDADRLQAIVENMLVLARIDGGRDAEMEPLLLRRITEAIVDEYRDRLPATELHFRADADVLPILGHVTFIRQVLGNLLTNAAKYSPPGTAIEIEVCRRGNDGVVLVSDRGFGVAADAVAHIFEPFYRAEEHSRKASGVGLGLAVCKRLVEQQGGAIWAEPRDGGGTVFGFSFPLLDAD